MQKIIIPFQDKNIIAYSSNALDKSAPTIVMIHGNSMSQKIWQNQMESSLTNDYQLISFDLPVHGESDDLPTYDVAIFTNAVLAVVNHLQLKNYIIAGNSLGGDLILQAATQLNNCKGMMLVDTPPLPKPGDMSKALLPNPISGMFFAADYDEANLPTLADAVFLNASTIADFFINDFKQADKTLRAALLASVVAGNYEDEVVAAAQLKIPLAVVVGKQEKIVNPEYFPALTLPTLWNKIELIDNAAHCPQWDNADAFNEILKLFAVNCLG